MKKLTIATWNVNSLRVRLQHLLDWLAKNQPDVIALQEIKLTNDFFPLQEIQAAGYSAVFAGEKSYNGVAILSRHPIDHLVLTEIPNFEDQSKRILGVTINSIRILNVYIPNGQSLDSPKYQYKLEWIEKLREHILTELSFYSELIVLGDFNIAPADLDVHNPERWKNKIHCSHPERAAFANLLSIGLFDSYRHLHPKGQAYTWWDYRLKAYERRWGLRIDHILLTKALLERCETVQVDESPRALERPSDHAPVISTFKAH